MAAKNQIAADVGARVLSEGGNAVDAAIAGALSLAVLEPWTSGLGSAGCMTIWDQTKRRGHVVDFPAALATVRASSDLMPPKIGEIGPEADALARAYATIAVPGQPDGLWAAHTFGTKSWPALVGPAVELSEQGLEIDWYAFLVLGLAAGELSRFARSRETFLPASMPLSYLEANSGYYRLRNVALTGVLRLLAERGARDFYEGLIAHAILEDLQQGGSRIQKGDLRGYRARVVEPVSISRDSKRFLVPVGGAVSSLFCSIMSAESTSPAALHRSGAIEFAHTFSATHAELHLASEELNEWSSHLAVIDGNGNMVSLAQSLGSVFGSKIVLPATGIVANNFGTVTHDVRRSDENARLVEHHLLPVLGISGDRGWLAIGVSGSRHILPTLVQLISFVSDFGFSLEDAFHQPRIGLSKSGGIQIDTSASPETKGALKQIFKAQEVPLVPHPFGRPCAVAVSIDPFTGERIAMTETTELWAGAAAVA